MQFYNGINVFFFLHTILLLLFFFFNCTRRTGQRRLRGKDLVFFHLFLSERNREKYIWRNVFERTAKSARADNVGGPIKYRKVINYARGRATGYMQYKRKYIYMYIVPSANAVNATAFL